MSDHSTIRMRDSAGDEFIVSYVNYSDGDPRIYIEIQPINTNDLSLTPTMATELAQTLTKMVAEIEIAEAKADRHDD